MARAPIKEDRTVMVRNRQAPMKSLLARRRGNLMVDTSQERHVVTQGVSQAIKLPLVRAKAKIGMKNLAYNMRRLRQLGRLNPCPA
jgi:hypothetical protein